MKLLVMALVATLGLGFSAQAQIAAPAVTSADVIANISHNVIFKTYQDLAKTSKDLKTAVDIFVATPNQQNLETAQNAWRAVRGAYEISEGFLFGPMDALGIDPLIDTWPLNLKDLRAILAGNNTLDADFVRSLGASVQGFHAIEFLLFGEGITTNTKDVATFTPREMQYLSITSALLIEQTDRLLYAWTEHFDPEDATTPAYIDVLSNPGANNQYYTTEQAVINEFVNGMIGIVAEAGDGKLPDATGKDPANANASLEESPFSWNSINDFTSNINSVLNIYTGAYAGHTGAGVKDLIAMKDAALADRVQVQMMACRDLIQAIKGPNNISFGHAIQTTDGRVRIFAAIKALVELRHTLENEVVPVIGK